MTHDPTDTNVDVKIVLPDVGDFVSVLKLRDGTLVNRWAKFHDDPATRSSTTRRSGTSTSPTHMEV